MESSSKVGGGESLPEGAKVAIAGGGIAGLEALMALRDLAEDRVRPILIARDPEFLYKPLVVEEPFSFQPAERRALAPIAQEFGAEFIRQAVVEVHADDHELQLSDGTAVGYHAAIICVGGRPEPAYRRAISFEVAPEPLGIDQILTESAQRSPQTVAFVVPPGVTWSLPLYELALLSRRRAEELGLSDLELLVVTPESSPLILFGPVASEKVTELLSARGISVRAATSVREDPSDELILVPSDEHLEASSVIALPRIVGPRIPGLPADDAGFIPIDDHSRVDGVPDVYAAGDGTTFPIKQGGIGTQQADAAAEEIAARAGAEVEARPFRPVLRGKLLTGWESLNLRAEPGGGGGEGEASLDYLWWPPHKVGGRYLASWLASETARFELEPPTHSLDVEVSLPSEWHKDPMALDPYGSPDVE
jgi:sulfide:quinone oxidoreductase